MAQSSVSRRFYALFVSALAVMLCAAAARAGLNGQPAPSKDVVEKVRDASASLLKGDIATARPALLLLVEANATTDLTGLLNRVIGDDTTYNGLTATFDEAASATKSETDKSYLLYNLARLGVLRARISTSGSGSQRAALDTAAQAADRFDANLADPEAWTLKGDIASLRGDLDGALASYRKIVKAGGGTGLALYKEGVAYERANQAQIALTTLTSALRGENTSGSGGPVLKYDIYQDLSAVYLLLGNDTAALNALSLSLRVTSDPDAQRAIPYRVDTARSLLQRGYAKAALAYAESALQYSPDNFDLQSLRDDARAASGRSR